MSSYSVRFSPAAARTFKKLPPDLKARIHQALMRLARDVAEPGRIGGKTVKTIPGAEGPFHNLRVGDYRVMYDVIEIERLVLVLGVVHRGDLERWIRNR